MTSYPISEIFTSPQGEGLFTGCMMTFLRLAGCSVGTPYPKDRYITLGLPEQCTPGAGCDMDMGGHTLECAVGKAILKNSSVLPKYTEKCTLYDGREFPCDTDYRKHSKMTIAEIMKAIPDNIEHICITGGEPFIHNLEPLVNEFLGNQIIQKIHIETSGTKPLSSAFPTKGFVELNGSEIWITVSPKKGVLPEMVNRADELKLLVDQNFSVSKLTDEMYAHPLVYLQPVNEEFSVNRDNLKRVMELQKEFPHWNISLQLHKVLSDYVEKRVR